MAFQQTSASVRAYYERNTRLFLRLGRNRNHATIHRAVWAAGVTTHTQALNYINDLVASTIQRLCQPSNVMPCTVLDLGCGVGGTLMHVAERLPIHGLGITISPRQVRLATAYANEAGFGAHCGFVEASYMQIPCSPHIDCAIAIESLVHAPDLADAIKQAAEALKPNAYLLVCDDMLVDQGAHSHANAHEWITAFRRGWQARSLVSQAAWVAHAERAGLQLQEIQDLTPDLRLLRLPTFIGDLVLRLGQFVPKHWAFMQSFLGGLALQYCLRYGIIRYQWLVFRKR